MSVLSAICEFDTSVCFQAVQYLGGVLAVVLTLSLWIVVQEIHARYFSAA